jgi:hypothetical protein
MTDIPFPVDDLNDDGASFMLEKLYGLPENCISTWASIGPVLERNKVSVQYSSSSAEWEAEVESQESSEYSKAGNPRLAIARALIKKTIAENPTNSFALKLPLKTAFSFGLKRESGVMNLVTILNENLNEEEKVTLELLCY